jgi:excisionase family DNA binding protein
MELLTPKDAASILGVTPDTLRRWAEEGKLGSETTAGGHRRYAWSEVERVRQQGRGLAAGALASLSAPAERQAVQPSRVFPVIHPIEFPEIEVHEEPQWRFRLVLADFSAQGGLLETLGLVGTEAAGYVSGGCLQFADFDVQAPSFGEAVGRMIDAVEVIAGRGRVISVERLDVLSV